MDKLAHQLTQNIQLKNKINHLNHHYETDYQTKRRRAVIRRNNRLKDKLAESYAIEKKLLHEVGVESYKSIPLFHETNLIALALGLLVGVIVGIFL